ncbi:MAG: ABC transporter ATP-binding protein [Acidimicrobiales bacterium]|jgi:oligopeptide/dipeptide ABC transporter ATP-binding protein
MSRTGTVRRGETGKGALVVSELSISVERGGRRFRVVDKVSFEVVSGGSFGIVGESGSGKSLTLRAVMGLVPPRVRVESGRAALGGVALPFSGRGIHRSRRRRVSMIFQDPLSALDPVHTVGSQVAEVPRRVLGLSRRASRERAIELMALVGLPEPARRAEAYPHQLSGGMRQRVLIAMALASEPAVLLCDEPTTAIDVTVQAQVLELLDDLRQRLGLTIVFVSHDLAVVRQVCDQVAVMYTGRLLEAGATTEILDAPAHPYTSALLDAVVDLDDPLGAPRPIPGSLPDPADLPPGCPFLPRCAVGSEDCRGAPVVLRPLADLLGEPGDDGERDAPVVSSPPWTDWEVFAPPVAWGRRVTACIHPERLASSRAGQ